MKFRIKLSPSKQIPRLSPSSKLGVFDILVFLIITMICSYMLYTPPEKIISDPTLKVGDIVKNDIIVKQDMTIKDEESSEEKLQNALKGLIPIYNYQRDSAPESQNLITEWFDFCVTARKRLLNDRSVLDQLKQEAEDRFGFELNVEEIRLLLIANSFSKIDRNRFLEVRGRFQEAGILSSKNYIRKSSDNSIRIISSDATIGIRKVDDIYDLNEVQLAILELLKDKRFNNNEQSLVLSILRGFFEVNLSYSKIRSDSERENITAGVIPVMINLKTGKIILRKGDEVKEEDLKILRLIEAEEELQKSKTSEIYLIILLIAFLLAFTWNYYRRTGLGGLNQSKLFLVSWVTLTFSTMLYRFSVFLLPLILKNITSDLNIEGNLLFFGLPFAFGALVIAFIFDLHSAVIYSLLNAIIGGVICNWDHYFVIYILLGNLAISYGIELYRREKRSSIFRVSLLWLIPINIIVILFYNLIHIGLNMQLLLFSLLLGLLSAVMALLLSSFSIPVWEAAFKLLSDLKLNELTNLNLPTFREMAEKAPGTYHHSQMVASLAEAAAQDLGRPTLLLRAMALYHDIGKLEQPNVFTENHSIYPDPHKRLSPIESSKMIISHIPDGIDKAKSIKLPEAVQSSIQQHHGTKLIRFFYEKAKEKHSIGVDELNEDFFRYPGLKPQNLENAIVMLADQVEAASKSLNSPSQEELANVIQHIITTNIEEDQFNECQGLTFKSLSIIAGSFNKKLLSIYHQRIPYPGIDFNGNGNGAADH